MYNILKDHPLSKEEFQLFPLHNNRNVGVSTGEEDIKKDGCSSSYDVGLAVVPFARSSKTVRRNSESHRQQEYSQNKNGFFSTSTSPTAKRFPWETIGHASREQSRDGIRVEQLSTKPFPFGVFGNRVVARRGSPTREDGISRSAHISKDDLPPPSKIMRRKKCSKTRQKRCGMDVESHVAQLRRKHAEFNWLPKAFSADDSYLIDPEQEEIVLPERSLQKVPNSSSPLPRNKPWSGVTPGFYCDSQQKAWPQEEYDKLLCSSDDGLSIEDQTIPNTSGLFEPERDDDNDEDFHLVGYAPSDSTSHPSDVDEKHFDHINYGP